MDQETCIYRPVKKANSFERWVVVELNLLMRQGGKQKMDGSFDSALLLGKIYQMKAVFEMYQRLKKTEK